MTLVEKLLEYFRENEEDFDFCIESMDTYCGYLNDDRCYPMDEFDDVLSGLTPTELANRMFYGHDDEYGRGEYSSFCPNRNYFYFNGYGNLVSTDTKDYTGYLDEYFCEQLIENHANIELTEGVQEILDEAVEDDE